MRICVYPGSFDPVTNGHLDIIERASKIFDKLIVAVLVNSSKTPVFSINERIEMIQDIVKDKKNIVVDSFSGMLIDYMKEKNAKVIIKGLRAVSDFEYEFQMALMNKKMNPTIDTLFMMTSSKYSYLSSSMVREIARHGGNISEFVPKIIKRRIFEKFNNGKG